MRAILCLSVAAGSLFAFSGCGNMSSVRTIDGHKVTLPKCKPAIVYQGAKWAVRGGRAQGVEVGAVEWERTFRDAEPLIQVIDKEEVERCHSLRTLVSVSTFEEAKREIIARSAADEKRRQLEKILAVQDAKLLKNYIDTYFLPVASSFYEEQKSSPNPSTVVVKTENSDQTFKLRNIDARPLSDIVSQ